LAEDRNGESRLANRTTHRLQVGKGIRLEEQRGRPAQAERGERGERKAGPDPVAARGPKDLLCANDGLVHAIPRTRSMSSSATVVMSPAPSVSTRSPGRTSSSRKCTTSGRRGMYTTRLA